MHTDFPPTLPHLLLVFNIVAPPLILAILILREMGRYLNQERNTSMYNGDPNGPKKPARFGDDDDVKK
jgi:hypothetical protein